MSNLRKTYWVRTYLPDGAPLDWAVNLSWNRAQETMKAFLTAYGTGARVVCGEEA